MFIRGEQDADRYYKNTTNKVVAFHHMAALLYFYDLWFVIPPLYATTIIGSFSPRIEKYQTDINLLNVSEYRRATNERRGTGRSGMR